MTAPAPPRSAPEAGPAIENAPPPPGGPQVAGTSDPTAAIAPPLALPSDPEPSFVLPRVPGWDWARLLRIEIFVIGVGCVGSALCDGLVSLGCRRFQICDPKRYSARHKASQCSPREVGKFKVDVVARRLRERGATVVAHRCAVEELEPGWVPENGVIVLCGDRASVEMAGNRLATRIRSRLVKVNLEPACLAASLRYFDYTRAEVSRCLECGWDEAQYRSTSVFSCDGSRERPTGSPRALSSLAGNLGAIGLAAIVASPQAAVRLDGHEVLLTSARPSLDLIDLPSNPACLCSHREPGNLERLDVGPEQVSLQDLARRTGMEDSASVVVCGSRQFATRAHCRRCKRDIDGLWWVSPTLERVGRCVCGGWLVPVAFNVFSSLERDQLRGVWERPLAALGIGPKAMITLSDVSRSATFVLAG